MKVWYLNKALGFIKVSRILKGKTGGLRMPD